MLSADHDRGDQTRPDPDMSHPRWKMKKDDFLLIQGLPGFEPGLLDSESKVITNYTIGPPHHDQHAR